MKAPPYIASGPMHPRLSESITGNPIDGKKLDPVENHTKQENPEVYSIPSLHAWGWVEVPPFMVTDRTASAVVRIDSG